ncbi:hypothetical protein [Francisella sp. LA112445]|uniref:hypothetical protein n=1 Tax=Francisella sp. LA112445 TaxID=1395624 RepID=UPI001788B599|nr:hypothetical protein [Francisella sp. LA112445]QIW10023.1 hypothetical protein FIP56_04725 [Francisella sp. LA112445]
MRKIILPISIIIILAIVVIVLGALNTTTKKSDSTVISKRSLYDRQTEKICSMLQQASALYQNNNSIKAVKVSDSAYWDVYDNIMEIKYRSYTSPADIFSIENSFHGYSDMLKQPASKNQLVKINKARLDICKELSKEAKILNKQS